MRSTIVLLVAMALIAGSCKKEKETPLSGEVTVDTKLNFDGVVYFAMGFHFETASLLPTHKTPFPDITLLANFSGEEISQLIIQAPPGYASESFALYGEYESASAAEAAFNGFATVTEGDLVWSIMGDNVELHQVWVYRRSDGRFAKMLIKAIDVEETSDNQLIALCTFRWVFQPEETNTFPQ